MKIYYCDCCGLRVSTDAFTTGEAVLKDEIATCSKCMQAKTPVHVAKPGGSSRTRIPSAIIEASANPSSNSSSPRQPKTTAQKAPRGNPVPTVVLVIVPLVILAWFFVLQKPSSYNTPESTAQKPAEPETKSPPKAVERTPSVAERPRTPAEIMKSAAEAPATKPAVAIDPTAEMQKIRQERAARLLQSAKEFAAANPTDFAACKDKYLEIVMNYRDSPAATEAIRLLADMKVPSAVSTAPAEPAKPITPTTTTPAPTVAASEPAPTPPATTAKPVEAPAVVAAPSGDAKTLYNAVAADIYGLIAGDQISAAKQRITQAQAEPLLQGAQAQLNLDAQLLELLAKTRADASKGAELLADKREFVLVKTDGKLMRVGGSSGAAVLGVKDRVIQIEQDLGGGKAQMKLDLAQVSLRTQYELAKLALPKTADSEMELGYTAFVLHLSGAKDVSVTVVQEHLKKAQASDALKSAARHLEERMTIQKSEAAADAAMKSAEAAVRDKKWADARKLLEAMKAEHADSVAYSQHRAWIDEKLEFAALQLSPLQPKLWSSYWKHLNGEAFKEFQFDRAEGKLSTESTMLPPAEKMEYINFGVRFQGLLRVEMEGRYHFKARADDAMTVWIDGKVLLQAVANISVTEVEIALTKGDHKIKIDFVQQGGSWSYGLQWQPPGAADVSDIPVTALWHDPKLIEQYKKE